MSTAIPAAIIETILVRLTTLFLIGTAGDTTAARAAATQMLAAYNPTTEEQFTLAATIISFSFQSLEALAQATDPSLSMTRILRLRSGAVSLSREADKARRRLSQLQKPQPEAKPAEAVAPSPVAPSPAASSPVAPPPPAPSATEQDRQRDLRIAANVQKAEARMFGLRSATPPSHHGSAANPAARHPT